MIWLLDSDIVNYLIKNRDQVVEKYDAAVARNESFVSSPVVEFEVTRYLMLRSMNRLLRRFNVLTRRWTPTSVTADDWTAARDLWIVRNRAGRPIDDADLLIAVSSVESGRDIGNEQRATLRRAWCDDRELGCRVVCYYSRPAARTRACQSRANRSCRGRSAMRLRRLSSRRCRCRGWVVG